MLEAQTIEKEVEKSLVELYPYTYKELVEYIKKENPEIKQGDINNIIKEDNLKKNNLFLILKKQRYMMNINQIKMVRIRSSQLLKQLILYHRNRLDSKQRLSKRKEEYMI